MELIIRMKTVTRLLIFTAAVLVWLVAMVMLNRFLLNQDDLVVVGAALLLALLTTILVARILRT